MQNNHNKQQPTTTNSEAVRQQAADSGLTYNQAKAWIAQNMNGSGTEIFSDTNAEEVKRRNQLSHKK